MSGFDIFGGDAGALRGKASAVIASEAKQSSAKETELDCFVAALLAMTMVRAQFFPLTRKITGKVKFRLRANGTGSTRASRSIKIEPWRAT
jgi:hypothetical protein